MKRAVRKRRRTDEGPLAREERLEGGDVPESNDRRLCEVMCCGGEC